MKKTKKPKLVKKVLIFYCEEAKELAIAVACRSHLFELQPIQWGKSADGFPRIRMNDPQAIEGQHVAFLASFSSPAVIFEQMSVIYMFHLQSAKSCTLVLSFFPTGISEGMEGAEDVPAAYALARILSSILMSGNRPTTFVTYDLHALQEMDLHPYYFGDRIRPCLEKGIPLLLTELRLLPGLRPRKGFEKVAFALPDDGAEVRFQELLIAFPVMLCTRGRQGDKTIVTLKEGDPRGYHVVIVDDLVQSGDTLIECQKILTANGAKEVSAYVTHAVFPNRSWERFIHKNDGSENAFSHFWVTDSCPVTVKSLENTAPFKVLSLARSIADKLRKEAAA